MTRPAKFVWMDDVGCCPLFVEEHCNKQLYDRPAGVGVLYLIAPLFLFTIYAVPLRLQDPMALPVPYSVKVLVVVMPSKVEPKITICVIRYDTSLEKCFVIHQKSEFKDVVVPAGCTAVAFEVTSSE